MAVCSDHAAGEANFQGWGQRVLDLYRKGRTCRKCTNLGTLWPKEQAQVALGSEVAFKPGAIRYLAPPLRQTSSRAAGGHGPGQTPEDSRHDLMSHSVASSITIPLRIAWSKSKWISSPFAAAPCTCIEHVGCGRSVFAQAVRSIAWRVQGQCGHRVREHGLFHGSCNMVQLHLLVLRAGPRSWASAPTAASMWACGCRGAGTRLDARRRQARAIAVSARAHRLSEGTQDPSR
jgi:hypothetical protein